MFCCQGGILLFLCIIITYIDITDGTPHGMVEIANIDPKIPEIFVDEEEPTVEISLQRVGGCDGEAKIRFQCFDKTANEDDYECLYRTVTWDSGDCNNKVINVIIKNDDIFEINESFLLRIYALNEISIGFDRLTITILKSDVKHGIISVFPINTTIIEGYNIMLQVYRYDGDYGNITACYDIIPGTARLVSDVEFVQGCLSWEHNELKTYNITVNTITNELWEGSEWFLFRLFNFDGSDNTDSEFVSNITIEQNYYNQLPLTTTIEPCDEENSVVNIDISVHDSFTIQYGPKLPKTSIINDAVFMIEMLTPNDENNIETVIIEIIPIIVDDELIVSCVNKEKSFDIIFTNHTNCTYEDVVEVDIDSEGGQSVNDTNGTDSRPIYCGEWLIDELSLAEQYVSESFKYTFEYYINDYSLWTDKSLATFQVKIKDYILKNESLGITPMIWNMYLVLDAYPCIETEWTEWSQCSAQPVGVGTQTRSRIAVKSLAGNVHSCGNITEHRVCIISKEKIVDISQTNVRIKEGETGKVLNVRLMGQLKEADMVARDTLQDNQLDLLRGYDTILYFDIPNSFKKELVIDPPQIGWNLDNWDTVYEVTITSIDDANIDALEQTVEVQPIMYSRDSVYNNLDIDVLTIIIEDNEKCRYCYKPKIDEFKEPTRPSFWTFQTILILLGLIVFVLSILYLLYRRWLKKNKKDTEYDNMDDFFVPETEQTISQSKRKKDYTTILSKDDESNDSNDGTTLSDFTNNTNKNDSSVITSLDNTSENW